MVGRRLLTLEKDHLPIVKTYPEAGRFVVDTQYDKVITLHCKHPVS
jgi:hypothetical protein